MVMEGLLTCQVAFLAAAGMNLKGLDWQTQVQCMVVERKAAFCTDSRAEPGWAGMGYCQRQCTKPCQAKLCNASVWPLVLLLTVDCCMPCAAASAMQSSCQHYSSPACLVVLCLTIVCTPCQQQQHFQCVKKMEACKHALSMSQLEQLPSQTCARARYVTPPSRKHTSSNS